MIRKSGSPLPVGSVASQSTSASRGRACAALQLPGPSPVSGSPTSSQAEPFDLKWLTTTVNREPVAFSSNVWASAGRSSCRGSADRRWCPGSRSADRGQTPAGRSSRRGSRRCRSAGVDEVVRPAPRRVEAATRSAPSGRHGVFSISLRPIMSASIPTSGAGACRVAVELERLVGVGAAAVEIGIASARPGSAVVRRGIQSQEEVERVLRGDRYRPSVSPGDAGRGLTAV